jgi:phosphopantothenoylcysteine decarboxylase/phosphopantothenate--cysteine ligase
VGNVVLGVSGSIASYRAADLARDLMREGHTVRVCLTDAAQRFVTPLLFETLTGEPCLIDTFDEPVVGRMAHIDWARAADLVLLAPATANTITRIAGGFGEDMLTTLVLATEAPLIVAPAMNPSMYANEVVQTALAALSARAATVLEPTEGDVVAGETGRGKLAANADILAAAKTVLARRASLRGKRVLITSGPTQEPIDRVRFLSNRSSGKMGAALARAALLMGADVTVIAGPQRAALPLRAAVVRVTTALEMQDALERYAPEADLIVGAAAVADYRPAHPFEGKLRRDGDNLNLELTPNPDVIGQAHLHPKPGTRIVGFAAEPTDDLEIARAKVRRKHLFAIAANDISRPEIGFDAETNELTLVFADGRTERSGLRSKLACALWILEAVTETG